jgi:hypothetical protein
MQLTPDEYETLNKVMLLLEPFEEITRVMCAAKHLSLSWVGASVNNMLSLCQEKFGDTTLIKILKGRLNTQVRGMRLFLFFLFFILLFFI